MPRDFAVTAHNEIRRRDRAVTDPGWIRRFLHAAPNGAMATVRDGQPFINSNLFVYDEAAHLIYLHTARVGRTQANIGGWPHPEGRAVPVCFSTFRMGRMLPASEAINFSVEYAGVTVFGDATLVDRHEETRHALQLLLDKYAPHLRPGSDYRPITDDELARTAVFRIRIQSWSGKKKEAEPDFPNAFTYRPSIDIDSHTPLDRWVEERTGAGSKPSVSPK